MRRLSLAETFKPVHSIRGRQPTVGTVKDLQSTGSPGLLSWVLLGSYGRVEPGISRSFSLLGNRP